MQGSAERKGDITESECLAVITQETREFLHYLRELDTCSDKKTKYFDGGRDDRINIMRSKQPKHVHTHTHTHTYTHTGADNE